jgi:hypothetical protein
MEDNELEDGYIETLRKQEAKRKEIEEKRLKNKEQHQLTLQKKEEKENKINEKTENKEKSKNNSKKIAYLLIILVTIIIITATIITIKDTTTPVTNMTLNTDYVYLTQNSTNFTISGTTNAGATINITSEELNLNQTPIKVDANGKFKYVVKVPKKVGFGKLTISALAKNKKPNSTSIEFKRTKPKTKTTTSENTVKKETTDDFNSLDNPVNVRAFLTDMDTNNDNKVSSYPELVDFALKNNIPSTKYLEILEKHDSNGDGKWDIHEIDAFYNNPYDVEKLYKMGLTI